MFTESCPYLAQPTCFTRVNSSNSHTNPVKQVCFILTEEETEALGGEVTGSKSTTSKWQS